ncbi:MAG: hypothetical protein O2816_04240 [Planctomycetota bacterium]|nr:hypothetical protein [Planctomycetota bacterium]
MRRCLLAALVCMGCVSPAAKLESVTPAAPTLNARIGVPVGEREDLEALAVRLDLLRSVRADLQAKVRDDSHAAERTWNVRLQSFDEHVLEFLEVHPTLHPDSLQKLEQRVLDPLEALRQAPGLDRSHRPLRD